MVFEFVGLLVGRQRELDLVVEFGDLRGVARDFAGGPGDRGVLRGGLTFQRLQLRGELVQGAGELRGGADDPDLGRFGAGASASSPQELQKADSWEASPVEEGSSKALWACWSSSAWVPAAPAAVVCSR